VTAPLNDVSIYLGRKDRKWANTRTLLLLMAEALVEGSEKMHDHLLHMFRRAFAP
jgi:hypothetical protein